MKAMSTLSTPPPVSQDDEDAPVIPAQRGYTYVLVIVCALTNLVAVSFAGSYFSSVGNGIMINLKIFATLIAVAVPFAFIWREKRPYLVVILVSAAALFFQLDSLMISVAVAAVVARTNDRFKTIACVAGASLSSLVAIVSDFLLPIKASFWASIFFNGAADDAVRDGSSLLTPAAWLVCVLLVAAFVGGGVIVGTVMRNSAISKRSQAQARSERQRANVAQASLSNKQIADSIAAEAHDTLAHSLSLIAVNATTLGADVERLKKNPSDTQVQSDLQRRSEDLRSQAAGALDEAHSIIDMLRNPSQAAELLAPGEDTALTQEALDSLFADVRESGTELRLWVDIRGLSALNPAVGKIAFRAIQEGLTNARRHAPGQPVSLSISVKPTSGITLTITNPVGGNSVPCENPSGNSRGNLNGDSRGNPRVSHVSRQRPRTDHGGNGLPGLKQRVERSHGQCSYGVDARGVFHLDVRLPFVPIS